MEFGPETYGDSFADVYDRWYAAGWPVESVVRGVGRLAEAVDRGPILELGSGTGRLALPFASHGNTVIAIDASAAMLVQLEAKQSGEPVSAVVADMAVLPLRSSCLTLAVCATNTFLGLGRADLQRRCLLEVARVLTTGGLLAVEAFVPSIEPSVIDRRVEVSRLDADAAVVTVTERDPAEATVLGVHVEWTGAGPRLRPWRLRYLKPAELDHLADEVGLRLRDRWSDWDGTPYVEGADVTHVSVYERVPRP